MKANNGIGLSGNQVGLKDSIFVMEHSVLGRLDIVNPQILSTSEESANISEGCLSAPGEFVVLKERKNNIKVRFQDETGLFKELELFGIDAVCFQHEYDHLQGISHLQSKSIPREKRREIKRKWKI